MPIFIKVLKCQMNYNFFLGLSYNRPIIETLRCNLNKKLNHNCVFLFYGTIKEPSQSLLILTKLALI